MTRWKILLFSEEHLGACSNWDSWQMPAVIQPEILNAADDLTVVDAAAKTVLIWVMEKEFGKTNRLD